MILGTSRAVRVFAYPAPVDLRKGYDGLYGLVQTGLGRDPLSGELFLFVNHSRMLCKVLVWDGTGLCIFQKRLEHGTFARLWRDDGQALRLTASEPDSPESMSRLASQNRSSLAVSEWPVCRSGRCAVTMAQSPWRWLRGIVAPRPYLVRA